MRFELARVLPPGIDAVVLPACSDALGTGDDNWTYLRARGFEGKVDQVATLPGADGTVIVLVGLGPSNAVTPTGLRRAAGTAARAVSRHAQIASHLLEAVPDGGDRVAAAQAVAEGFVLGAYQFGRYRTALDANALERVVEIGTGGRKVEAALGLGARIADGICLARDLVNEPGGALTPAALAEVAVEIAEREDLGVTVLDEDDIVEQGMGGLLGVNRGSNLPPRFIELCYEPASPRGSLAIVGKGITFDSGGLSIKTAAGMMTMKSDMAGAAAVLGAFSCLRAVNPRIRVRGYLPCTDNMTGGDATRPGDVLRLRSGTTVEVLNTDAEGRLVLADALSAAAEAAPDAIVDLATLTGGVGVALGNRIAAVLGTSDDLVAQVRDAADRAGERLWPLPRPEDYRRRLDSEVADLANISRAPGASTILGGLFLEEFVPEGMAWAHLDIAETAWSDEVAGELVKGGTGYGVRLLLELVRHFRKPR